MDGRLFVDVARELAGGNSEAHWRSSVGRAYYGLMHKCLDALVHWGFFDPAARQSIHTFVRFRFTFPADADLKFIGAKLELLGKQRSRADYQLNGTTDFQSAVLAKSLVHEADAALTRLAAIRTDPVREAAAIAAITKAFPPSP
jgi:hypothetical protein